MRQVPASAADCRLWVGLTHSGCISRTAGIGATSPPGRVLVKDRSPPTADVRPDLSQRLLSTRCGQFLQPAFSSAASPWEVDRYGSAQTPSKHASAPDTSMALSAMRQQTSTQWYLADTICAGRVVPWSAGRCLVRRQCEWHTVHRGVSAQRIAPTGSCPATPSLLRSGRLDQA